MHSTPPSSPLPRPLSPMSASVSRATSVGGSPRLPAAEARIIERFFQEESDPAYVQTEWWEEWKKYSGFQLNAGHRRLRTESDEASSLYPPGPLPLDSGGTPVQVNQKVIDQLLEWYPYPVSNTPTPSILKLNVISLQGKSNFTLKVSGGETMGSVVEKALDKAGRTKHSPDDRYLYDPSMQKEFYRNDATKLQETGVMDRTSLYIISPVRTGQYQGKAGLVNLGNTCYMNAGLQCLLHTPELMDYFLLKKYRKHLNLSNPDGSGGQLANQFSGLMDHAWMGKQRAISPGGFFKDLTDIYGIFTVNEQHDTAELAENLLDCIMEDTNQACNPKPYIQQMPDGAEQTDKALADIYWNYHLSRSKSYITDRFHGQYYISMHCPNCQHTSRSFEAYSLMHLGIPPVVQRTLRLSSIDVGGGRLSPESWTIDVSSTALIEDVYCRIGEVLGVKGDQPWSEMRLILHRKPFKFLHTKDPVSSILETDEVLLYLYGDSPYGPSSGGTRVCFLHHKDIVGHEEDGRGAGSRFGQPLFLWMPDDAISSTDDLSDMLDEVLAPLKQPILDDASNLQRQTCSAQPYELRSAPDSQALNVHTFDICWHPSSKHHYNHQSLKTVSHITRPSQPSHSNRSDDTTLDHCIHHDFEFHTEAITASNLWYCPNCHQHVDAVKTKKLWRIPDVLIVAFKRFQYDAFGHLVKVDRSIRFPSNGLKLDNHYSKDAPIDSSTYDLYGVCHHHGRGLGSGHYTSYVKSSKGQWQLFNDSRVEPATERQVINRNAYLLFYRKRQATCPTETEILSEYYRFPEIRAIADYRRQLTGKAVTVGDIYAEFSAERDRMVVEAADQEIVPDAVEDHPVDPGEASAADQPSSVAELRSKLKRTGSEGEGAVWKLGKAIFKRMKSMKPSRDVDNNVSKNSENPKRKLVSLSLKRKKVDRKQKDVSDNQQQERAQSPQQVGRREQQTDGMDSHVETDAPLPVSTSAESSQGPST